MIIVTLLILVILGVGFIVYKLTRVPSGRIPPMVAGPPLIGNAVRFGMDPINLIMESRAKHGDVFTLKVFHEHMIFFVGNKGHDFFFKTPEDVFNAAAAYKFTVPLFGKGVVYDGPPELLIEERKIIGRGLSKQRFQQYVPMIEEEARQYFNAHWGDVGEADLHRTFNEVTVLTSTTCLQGREIREQVDEFTKLYWIMDASLDSISFFFPNLPLPKQFKRDRAREKVDVIFKKIIRKRREAGIEALSTEPDLIATLLSATLDDGSKLTDDQIVGMMIALLIAGQHTSNVTGTWLGCNFLQSPDLLNRARQELEDKIGGPDALSTFENVRECTFLEHCVKESLRLRPPIITLLRRVLQPTTYEGYDIPEGTLVGVSTAAGNRLPEIYTNPDKFDPDRWAEPRSEHKKSPYAFMAFGGGRHACIGETFGILQTKTIYAWLLRNYDIELKEGAEIKPDFTSMVVSAVPPIPIRYKRRK